MNSIAQTKNKPITYVAATNKRHIYLLLSFLLISTIYTIDKNLFKLIVETVSDAYLAVSVFVALTLSLVYLAHQYFKADLISYLNNSNAMQVPMATFLGVLPGCGGAIVVVTQFVRGQVSFGALVAVLISTMGDASFLLLTRSPSTAAIVFSACSIAAIISGYLVDHIHGHNFLKKLEKNITQITTEEPKPLPNALLNSWLSLLAPGSILGILLAFQVDTNSLFGAWSVHDPTMWLGFIGALLSVIIWTLKPLNSWSIHYIDTNPKATDKNNKRLWESVATETSFVSIWVLAGFLCFELLLYFTGWDLSSLFKTLGPLTPLLATLVGFIPGCSPQIIMTSLYLQGIVPLSAQLANATSNDGDALFPAIAMAPKAATYATLYSAIPALILGYAAYSLGY